MLITSSISSILETKLATGANSLLLLSVGAKQLHNCAPLLYSRSSRTTRATDVAYKFSKVVTHSRTRRKLHVFLITFGTILTLIAKIMLSLYGRILVFKMYNKGDKSLGGCDLGVHSVVQGWCFGSGSTSQGTSLLGVAVLAYWVWQY